MRKFSCPNEKTGLRDGKTANVKKMWKTHFLILKERRKKDNSFFDKKEENHCFLPLQLFLEINRQIFLRQANVYKAKTTPSHARQFQKRCCF